MKYNEVGKTKSHHKNLDSLDKALHDLDMLSAITEARRDYLRESKSNYGVMRLNTRYVSNVTVGYCMKKNSTKNRICPYVLPVRHRTKSENSDVISSDISDIGCDIISNLVEPSTSSSRNTLDFKCSAKRCQSLENLSISTDINLGSELSPEMDCMSTQIQKLQVDE